MTELKSKIPGAKVLLMGGTGTGKTYCLRTLIEAGITPFIIFSEPGMESISDLPGHQYHYKYIAPTISNWSALEKIGDLVNKMSYEALIKMSDANRTNYHQWIDVIKTNNDFVCDECGEHFGDVQKWGTNRALVMDSLTGFSEMAIRLVIGGKVARSQSDWGIGQEMVRKVLDAWTTGTRCWFVLTAHEAREQDQVTGAIKIMASTLGRALAPEIPRYFSDVIECTREGTNFYWNTDAANVDTKARNVPLAGKLQPSFVPLVKRWQEKGGVLETPEDAKT
jgi:uncharacterized membrane protein